MSQRTVKMTDREINAKVAEKLGVKPEIVLVHDPIEGAYNNSAVCYKYPEYSTSIEAAWEIVEQAGLWVTVSRILNREFGLPEASIYATYHCEIYRNHSDLRAMGEATAAPMAICLAFLKMK